MKIIIINKTEPTADQIDNAIAVAATMWGTHNVATAYGQPHTFFVTRRDAEGKIVEYCVVIEQPGKERCTCDTFAEHGVCHHQAFVHQWKEIEAGEAAAEASAEATIERGQVEFEKIVKEAGI